MLKIAFLPLVLLAALGIERGFIYRRDNPPVTLADLKVRRILQNARSMQFGGSGEFFTPQQKQTLISHFWISPSPIERTYPQPTGSEFDIYIKLPPGQGNIVLEPDPADSYLLIEHWHAEENGTDFIPSVTSEEDFTINPATNRFLRAWLEAGAP